MQQQRQNHIPNGSYASSREKSRAEAERIVQNLLTELNKAGYYGQRVIELKSQDGVITTARIQSEKTVKLV